MNTGADRPEYDPPVMWKALPLRSENTSKKRWMNFRTSFEACSVLVTVSPTLE